jgi:hypothetical protein
LLLLPKKLGFKKDKKGEKTSPKNCFSNPFNHLIYTTTALGCYFAIHDEAFAIVTRKTFFKIKEQRKGLHHTNIVKCLLNYLKSTLASFINSVALVIQMGME